MKPLKIGVAGPVGSGKTSLIETLTGLLSEKYKIAIVTNDIYTQEDADYLRRNLNIDPDMVVGVETGGCPHTAIRDDISLNMNAAESLIRKYDPDIVFIESGGDNLSATFSYELIDIYFYVIDVAQGADIPRKKGMGLLQCDLLAVNKTDLAPHVDVDLESMERDVKICRGSKPYIFLSRKKTETYLSLTEFIEALM